jgi:hypothetical protein
MELNTQSTDTSYLTINNSVDINITFALNMHTSDIAKYAIMQRKIKAEEDLIGNLNFWKFTLAHGSICYCKPEKHFENIKKFEQNVTLMP